MLEIGQEFRGYSIVKSLGNRRAIENYQAKRLASGALVRLTLLADELLPDRAARNKFIVGVQTLCSVDQAGIARMLEVGDDEARAFYVTEFYPGGNFKQVLGKKMPPGQALRILRNIARTLAQLHVAGFAHGNLKPGNILLGPEGRPVLTDVGVTPLLKLDFNLGIDPYYVSPEQVRGDLPGPASDIYSLGIALYQMLCGLPPFQADNDFRIAMLRFDEPVPQLAGELSVVQPLLERMLDLDPSRRITSSDLATALDSFIVQADAIATRPQVQKDALRGDDMTKKGSADDGSQNIAQRIEKTLTDREKKRLDDAALAIEVAAPERAQGEHPYFSYVMLLLGVLVGAVIGAAFYFVLPEATDSGGIDRVQTLDALDEANRLAVAGNNEKAKKTYLSVISENPASPRAYNNLASLYATEGDLEQAQVLLKKALETNADYLTIYRNIGTVYAAMARDSYGKALQLDGEKKQVRLQYLGLASPVPQLADVSAEKSSATVVAVTNNSEAYSPATGQTEPAPVKEPVVKGETAAKSSLVDKQKQTTPPRSVPSAVGAAIETQKISTEVIPPVSVVKSVSPQLVLQDWAMAWSSQDVDTYLASYAPEYVPAGGLTLAQWQEKRKHRIQAPSFIEVKLDSFESIRGTGDTAEIRLIQDYRSDRYRDRTRKSFILRRHENSWLIVEERSLGRVD